MAGIPLGRGSLPEFFGLEGLGGPESLEVSRRNLRDIFDDFDFVALLFQECFDVFTRVLEPAEVVGNQMAHLAMGALDDHNPLRVRQLGKISCGPGIALGTGEDHTHLLWLRRLKLRARTKGAHWLRRSESGKCHMPIGCKEGL